MSGRNTDPRWGPLQRRVGWGVADQALSSATNFGLTVAAARGLSREAFGAFGLAFTAYTFALGVARAIGGEPLLIRYSKIPESSWRSGVRESAGAVLMLGLVGTVAGLIAGSFAGGPLRSAFFALAVVLPGLLLQDAWRFAFFASGRGRAAFMNDLVWAGVQFAALLILLVLAPSSSVGPLVLIWGGAATVAAAIGVLQSRAPPAIGRSVEWWRRQRDLVPRILGEFAAVSGASQAAIFGVGALAGLSAVGAIRGALMLMGPVNIVVLGMSLVAIPENVGLLKKSVSALRRGTLVYSVGLGALAATWGCLVLLVPASVGKAVLGETWTSARSALLGVILWQIGLAISVGPVASLRALAAIRRSLRVRLLVAPVLVAGALGGATLGGARGASLGLGITNLVAAAIWWLNLERALREHDSARRRTIATADEPQ
jgi:hypothetical protein